jgi:hypothetical protein
MPRAIVDALTLVTTTLPNAANTCNSNGIDLGATTPYPLTESILVNVAIGVATGANNKNINIRIMDSADNTTFTNVAVIANPVLRSVDANAAGHSASNVTIALPPTIKRYVRATALGEADGGDSSDGSFYIKLLY